MVQIHPETPISRMWLFRGHPNLKFVGSIVATLTMGVLLMEQLDRILRWSKREKTE